MPVIVNELGRLVLIQITMSQVRINNVLEIRNITNKQSCTLFESAEVLRRDAYVLPNAALIQFVARPDLQVNDLLFSTSTNSSLKEEDQLFHYE